MAHGGLRVAFDPFGPYARAAKGMEAKVILTNAVCGLSVAVFYDVLHSSQALGHIADNFRIVSARRVSGREDTVAQLHQLRTLLNSSVNSIATLSG